MTTVTSMLWGDHILPAGLTADRPAATAVAVGALYASTDDGVIYRNNGTTWDTYASTGASMLSALTDVDVTTTAPTDGQVLEWVSADSKWEPRTVGGGTGTVDSVAEGTGINVDATDPANPIVAADIGTASGQVAAGNDVRFTDARTPTAHAASHANGGTDEVALDASQVTTGTVATARLGSGTADSTTFLRGDGTWAAGAGGGGGVATVTAGDSTITIGGTGTDPTVAVNAIAESQVTNLTTDLAAKAPLASPTFTGDPKAPTPTAGDNDTSIATTAFVATSFAPLASPTFTGHPVGVTETAGTNSTRLASTAYADNAVAKQPETLIFALGDETTAITTGTKVTVRMPFAMTLTAVRASLTTASSSGNPAIDIKESGTTIFSTTLTIDATEKTSTTAATPAVISDASLADDAEMTFIVNTAGTGAAGLKVTLIGTRT